MYLEKKRPIGHRNHECTIRSKLSLADAVFSEKFSDAIFIAMFLFISYSVSQYSVYVIHCITAFFAVHFQLLDLTSCGPCYRQESSPQLQFSCLPSHWYVFIIQSKIIHACTYSATEEDSRFGRNLLYLLYCVTLSSQTWIKSTYTFPLASAILLVLEFCPNLD